MYAAYTFILKTVRKGVLHMRINEVIQHVDLSKRAVKYYEDQGLLQVGKDENGYRNYTEGNVETLKEISLYRKLGIRIQDIKHLMSSGDRKILEHIYQEKLNAQETGAKELEALHAFMENHDAHLADQSIDYQTIAQALQDMVPGFYGYYFMNHFMPYLQIQAVTPGQQQAYRNIVDYWDNTRIKIPLMMRLVSWIMYRLMPQPTAKQMAGRMDAQLKKYMNPSEEEYAKLRSMIERSAKLKNSFPMKYHPAFILQRRFMKQLQDKGYNDIFIPNMIALSPPYKAYHDALTEMNSRICKDLGLYYDSQFRLVMKKPSPPQQ